jgi:hypothetical protein
MVLSTKCVDVLQDMKSLLERFSPNQCKLKFSATHCNTIHFQIFFTSFFLLLSLLLFFFLSLFFYNTNGVPRSNVITQYEYDGGN